MVNYLWTANTDFHVWNSSNLYKKGRQYKGVPYTLCYNCPDFDSWVKNKDSENTIKADWMMDIAGNSVATAVFMNAFDEMTDNIVLGNNMMPSLLNENYRDRLFDYTDKKWRFYVSMDKQIQDFNNLPYTETYSFGPDIEELGETDYFHKGFDKNIKYQNLY